MQQQQAQVDALSGSQEELQRVVLRLAEALETSKATAASMAEKQLGHVKQQASVWWLADGILKWSSTGQNTRWQKHNYSAGWQRPLQTILGTKQSSH